MPTAKSKAETGEGKAGQWAVIDTNAMETPRIHEPIVGKKVALRADEKTYMEMPMAVRFLCDPAFHVFNEHGQRVKNMPDKMATVGKMPELQPGETIAHVEELMKDALLARAARKPGGERFTSKTTREELIHFLVKGAMSSSRGGGDPAPVDDGTIVDDEDDDFSASMLEGQLDQVKAGG